SGQFRRCRRCPQISPIRSPKRTSTTWWRTCWRRRRGSDGPFFPPLPRRRGRGEPNKTAGGAMALYFLLLDAGPFHAEVAPALTAAWRQGSFAPCRDLSARLLPAAQEYAVRYHTGPDDGLLERLARPSGVVPFDRELWRFLVGEVLLYAAAE